MTTVSTDVVLAVRVATPTGGQWITESYVRCEIVFHHKIGTY